MAAKINKIISLEGGRKKQAVFGESPLENIFLTSSFMLLKGASVDTMPFKEAINFFLFFCFVWSMLKWDSILAP